MKSIYPDRFGPGYYPTPEELLDVNFQSIVSDLRGIISGTLTPRTWSDISSTWHDDGPEIGPRITQMASDEKIQRNIKKSGENQTKRNRILKMMHILMSNGMDEIRARETATELLK